MYFGHNMAHVNHGWKMALKKSTFLGLKNLKKKPHKSKI